MTLSMANEWQLDTQEGGFREDRVVDTYVLV